MVGFFFWKAQDSQARVFDVLQLSNIWETSGSEKMAFDLSAAIHEKSEVKSADKRVRLDLNNPTKKPYTFQLTFSPL